MNGSSRNYWENPPRCLKFLKNNAINTKRAYFHAIKKYEKFHGLSIEELVCEALDEQTEGVPKHYLKVIGRIEDFQEYLIEEDLVFNTVKSYVTKIKAIYHKNRVDIPYIEPINPKKVRRRDYIEFKDILTKEEIKTALKHMRLPSQARTLVMAQGGLSNEECEHLTTKAFIEDLKRYHQCDDDIDALKWLQDENHPVIWTTMIIRKKTQKPYYAVIGPEAVNKIAEAKLYERGLPKNKGKIPSMLLSENKASFGRLCRRISERIGLPLVAEESKLRPHNLRRFHATYIQGSHLTFEEKSKLSLQEIDEMQGRGKTSTQDTYIKSNPFEQKLLYARVMNNVMFFHEYGYEVIDGDVNVFHTDLLFKTQKLEKQVLDLTQELEKRNETSEKVDILINELGDKGIKEMMWGFLMPRIQNKHFYNSNSI